MRVGRQTCIYYAINLLANEFSHDPRCAQSMFCDINGNGTKIMEMSLKTACVIHKKCIRVNRSPFLQFYVNRPWYVYLIQHSIFSVSLFEMWVHYIQIRISYKSAGKFFFSYPTFRIEKTHFLLLKFKMAQINQLPNRLFR